MRLAPRLALCALITLALATAAHAQVGYDRPGGDYGNFAVRSGDPAVCAARCEREQRCTAWSFSYPRTVAANAVCFLKSTVTPRVEDGCCMSSVKGAGVMEPRGGATEFSIDRIGGDYKNFETPPDPTGNACQEACAADSRCRTWTYLRPGYDGPAARCFLKDRLTRPHHKPCCVSGVVR
jgi:PAN domain